jgi:hypothetical protein
MSALKDSLGAGTELSAALEVQGTAVPSLKYCRLVKYSENPLLDTKALHTTSLHPPGEKSRRRVHETGIATY